MKSHLNPLGIVLFVLYLLLYVGFVLLTAFWPDSMKMSVYGGVNLAVFYGFGLIISALVFALIYGLFGTDTSESDTDVEEGR